MEIIRISTPNGCADKEVNNGDFIFSFKQDLKEYDVIASESGKVTCSDNLFKRIKVPSWVESGHEIYYEEEFVYALNHLIKTYVLTGEIVKRDFGIVG